MWSSYRYRLKCWASLEFCEFEFVKTLKSKSHWLGQGLHAGGLAQFIPHGVLA